jgi:hypothetical protein
MGYFVTLHINVSGRTLFVLPSESEIHIARESSSFSELIISSINSCEKLHHISEEKKTGERSKTKYKRRGELEKEKK